MESDASSTVELDQFSPELAGKLKPLTPGHYCTHKSWGFGKIREWNTVLGQVIIDFQQKSGHPMQFEYAAQTLTPLPASHIFVQKKEDLAGLKTRASQAPAEVVRQTIESLGPQATQDGIQAALSPEIIPAAEWKKWWENAKRALKKDGHFYIPTKKSEPLRLLDAPAAMGDQALTIFRNAIGGKAQLAALINVSKQWPDIKSDAVAEEIGAALNQTLQKIPKSQTALALELALARDEFFELAGKPAETGALSVVNLTPKQIKALTAVIEDLPGLKQGKLLKVLQAGMGEGWSELFLGLLPQANARVAETVAEAFLSAGREAEVTEAVNRLIKKRSVTCDFLFWLCKTRSQMFGRLIEPQLLMAILSVLENDQFSDIKKGTKLYELVLNDKELIAELLKGAPIEDVRDITRAVILSPVFEELDKRSFLATFIKLYPDVQAMIVSEKTAEDATLIVSWASLQKRKKELEDIVTRKIPENSKEIGIARSYGDLRENHEFKAAKEMQTVLMRRKAELETMLLRAQGTDFKDVETAKVNIGTRVTLKLEGGGTCSYTILGAWDSDPAAGIISYLTPVAKALLNRTVGETVELPADDARASRAIIEKIESHQ
jgi:transcription elongation GreA/GreB family factor